MSSISSIGNGIDLFGVVQQATGADTTSAATLASQIAGSSQDDAAGATQEVQHHGGHHGHHGLQGKIQSAVTSALQNADPSEDPNQVVQDAIASVLKGQDGAGGATNGQNGSAGQTGGAGATGSAGGTSQSAFSQLLQANGISASQFQSDLKAAWQSDDGGQGQGGGTANGSGGGTGLNFSTLFQSFPPGTALDTTA